MYEQPPTTQENIEPLEKPEEKENDAERKRFDELKQRYLKLFEWAKNQKFETVYRAEGDPSWNISRSASEQHVGTWYTPSFQNALKYKSEVENLSEKPGKLYSLIIPVSSLDSRDEIDKGMNQVNVLNQDLRAGRMEIADAAEAKEPSLENYLNQFEFVKEYRALAGKYSN